MASEGATTVLNLDHLSWTSVATRIYRSLIEVSNGLKAERVLFKSSLPLDHMLLRKQAEEALERAWASPYHWFARCHWIPDDEGGLALIILSTRQYNSYSPSHSGLLAAISLMESSELSPKVLYRLAFELDNRSLRHSVPESADKAMLKLLSVAKSNSLLLAALAAEILTNQGIPTLPTQAIFKSQENAGSSAHLVSNETHVAATFETRINVDSYNFFELVHPAYFRQTVALAGLVAHFVKTPHPHAIDVGPGPGTNLLAFHELMPDTRVLAIEPSDVAFWYLQDHFKGNPKITCLKEDFLCVSPDVAKIDYIMSTGESHHFNTAAFLQRSMEWLRPGSYWFIADEMITPYVTRVQRSLNLLRHHLAYMAPLCFPWSAVAKDAGGTDSRTPDERAFVDDYNRSVPLAKFYADNEDVKAAEAICRALLTRSEQFGFTTKVSDLRLSFWRLQWLELQALVAGLDYEVEQKTSPRHFIKMAEGAGFTLIRHERVYGTDGPSEFGGGTHVMAFQKS
ncbi:class I SAM-dependent methyltransferase [Aspergillus mulundensis]|uniref:Methyltransferase domain-containing protein n=1 Tax=Aspergillus mulundensis TaxID=1810919 RepID=A0A3D8T5J1_9EURO|nr:hypothetical protein DSM5745_01149 [Aspergillus mulundensis]RDW93827.1 hypothetical protein DSM5745_01149 [Aspergillus mulundensis]